ncbi:Na(+)-translocating NADH-quinone reductase subunit C [bacterium]|nr:Na(+)-translocating NADH-quinone reductase subunit C [Rubripirellula sp.]MDB4500408.1 Na(+)-translocating NADH-quinone reductase subunit C [bacterium]MDB4622066.1 Na(+)-translocating NADH-quinone reductase subunit C [Rubripirellula sp.]
MQQRDSLGYTLGVAAVLCVACSLAVSTAAVSLRGRQEANVKLDQQKNILDATGLAIGEYGVQANELTTKQIDTLNAYVSSKLVDLETGAYDGDGDPEKYNLVEEAANPETSIPIESPTFNPGEPRRPKVMKVYFVKKPGTDKILQVVLPVYGKGLWGTLYGYLALKSDLETIQGLTFYQHKETPGLGGEVDNPRWKAMWDGRKLYDEETGQPKAMVFKGPAPKTDEYAVDGLSGATITSRGVTNLIRYWASDDGYGTYLSKLKEEINDDKSSASEGDK